jgi:hypothetical protein
VIEWATAHRTELFPYDEQEDKNIIRNNTFISIEVEMKDGKAKRTWLKYKKIEQLFRIIPVQDVA